VQPAYWTRDQGLLVDETEGSKQAVSTCTSLPLLKVPASKVLLTRLLVGGDVCQLSALFNALAQPAEHGKGRDSHKTPFRSFEVVKVERIQSKKLWRAFAGYRRDLPPPLGPLPVVPATERYQVLLPKDLANPKWTRPDLHEYFLFHATKRETVQHILENGFDERVCKLKGLFGAASYFADSPSKADQYAIADDSGIFCMFVCRVVLGTSLGVMDARMRGERIPPLVPDHESRRYDSVTGVAAAAGSILKRFHEFVVYDGNQVYPELLVSYKRVP
jgi:hypothetical protein